MKTLLLIPTFLAAILTTGCTISRSPSAIISNGHSAEFNSSKDINEVESCIDKKLRETIIRPNSSKSSNEIIIYGYAMDSLTIIAVITKSVSGSTTKYYKDFIPIGTDGFLEIVKNCQ
jgi:hypothetical protein